MNIYSNQSYFGQKFLLMNADLQLQRNNIDEALCILQSIKLS